MFRPDKRELYLIFLSFINNFIYAFQHSKIRCFLVEYVKKTKGIVKELIRKRIKKIGLSLKPISNSLILLGSFLKKQLSQEALFTHPIFFDLNE